MATMVNGRVSPVKYVFFLQQKIFFYLNFFHLCSEKSNHIVSVKFLMCMHRVMSQISLLPNIVNLNNGAVCKDVIQFEL